MPNLGTYGLDPMGGGVATAQSDPLSVPTIGSPDMSFGGDMQAFMKKALMEQYERKKQEQAEQQRLARVAEIQAREDRAMGLADRNTALRNSQIDRMGQQGQMNAMRARQGGEARPDVGGLGANARSMEADQMMLDRAPQVKFQTGGPGILGGFVQADPHTMNAATRKNYLPGGSSIVGDKTAGPAIGSEEFATIDAMNQARKRGYGR